MCFCKSARNSTQQITCFKVAPDKKNRLKTTIFQNLEIPQGEILHKSLANSLLLMRPTAFTQINFVVTYVYLLFNNH